MTSEFRFPEVRKLLEQAEYELVRINGSHHIFARPGQSPLSIPVHNGKVKAFYVRQIRKKIIEIQGEREADTERDAPEGQNAG